jgi:glycine betaine/proline transport system ATP-binding protein
MTEPFIRVRSLYKLFGPTPDKVMPLVHQGLDKDEILARTGHTLGLKDINLDIDKGRIFVVMGLSGSGKSTLIRHFNRLIDPDEGSLVIDGVDVLGLGERELERFRRERISMVFQRFGLFPHRSVIENVAYGLKVRGLPKAQRLQRAREWIDTVGLSGYEEQYPSQLSGGQQQRVGLARALCTDSDILLMDEAFSALDPLIRSEMQDQLIELQEKLHKTIIFITHDLDEALRLGDRIAILRDGELVQEGAPEEILLRPADAYVEAFVKDVNRARALTVEAVMKPPACRITADTISGALKQMRNSSGDYGYYITEEGYRGVVSHDALQQAARHAEEQKMSDEFVEAVPGVSPDALIEEVLPDTLDAEYPLPVVDTSGDLQGELSRESLARALVSAAGEMEPAPRGSA